MALARTPLMAAAVPATDPTLPDSGRPAPPGPETAEASVVPTETDPNCPERGGENKDWLSADSWAGNETEMDSETSIARVRDELHHLASNSGPVMKTGAKFLLSLMDKQVYTFSRRGNHQNREMVLGHFCISDGCQEIIGHTIDFGGNDYFQIGL